MPSFTLRIPSLHQIGPVVELILTPSLSYLQTLGLPTTNVKAVKVSGLIDTGATGTVISQGLAQQLGINPVGTTYIIHPLLQMFNACNLIFRWFFKTMLILHQLL